MSDELKPCPFCDGKSVDCTSMLGSKEGWILYLKCPDCHASFRVLEQVWNFRLTDNVLKDRIAKMNQAGHELLSLIEEHGSRILLAHAKEILHIREVFHE